MLQTLITGTDGPVPIYKIDQHRFDLQCTGCGLESVPKSVLTPSVNFENRLALWTSV